MTGSIPDSALDADIAILGKKGRGKTYTAKGIVERLLDLGRRVVVIDPLSVWWGLKSSADGERPGYPIAVFGGPHGDMPLTEEMGRPLARIIAWENLPTIIDVGQMTKAAWQRLVADMLDELFKANREPLWIVLEEADVFAPQQPRPDDSMRVLGEVDRMARRGRAYGFRLISITQRPAKLNKDVLTQLSTLVALGLTSPQDRDAIKAWVEGNADRDKAKEVMSTLAKLPVGEGWVWSPDHDILARMTFPAIRTLDTSATPKAGVKQIRPKTLADVDLSAVREALSIAESEKGKGGKAKVATALQAAASAAELEAAEQRGYRRGRDEGFQEGRNIGGRQAARNQAARIVEAIAGATLLYGTHDILIGAAERIKAIDIEDAGSPSGRTAGFGSADAGSNPAPAAKASPARQTAPKAARTPSIGKLHSAARKILAVLDTKRKILAVLDTNPPVRRTWVQVATLAGLKARGGHFNAGRKALLDTGAVAEIGGLIQIASPSGEARPPVSDPHALVEMWEGVIGGAGAKIVRKLFEIGGRSTKADIADRLGMKLHGGHWNSGVKALRDNDIVVQDGDHLTLTELFHPKGPTP